MYLFCPLLELAAASLAAAIYIEASEQESRLFATPVESYDGEAQLSKESRLELFWEARPEFEAFTGGDRCAACLAELWEVEAITSERKSGRHRAFPWSHRAPNATRGRALWPQAAALRRAVGPSVATASGGSEGHFSGLRGAVDGAVARF